MNYRLSIIVPTYNGAAKIPLLLESLLRQTFQDFELVVVIDGSNDGTEEILQSYHSRFKALKIISQVNSGRSAVRNRGASEASGEVLIFYDDDMEPDSDSVDRHNWFHRNYKGILVGNPLEFKNSKKTDFQNYKAGLTSIWTKKYSEGLTPMDHSNLFVTAANCSIAKNQFFDMEGFDERLTDVEDYDFGYRALERKIPVFFDKSNRAIHHDSITAKKYIHRLRLYGMAHSRLLELHPERKHNVTIKKSYLKRILYRVMANPYLVKLIDKGFFKEMFSESIRFKIYDFVIQALAVEFPWKRL
jgi:glycosyltransferase involved in cell wall biosynthesis